MDKSSLENFSPEILTFLFSDLVDSTTLWEKYPKSMPAALRLHDDIFNKSVRQHGGKIVKSTGDGVMAVFISPTEALIAAIAAQKSMQSEAWHDTDPLMVRIGLHTGKAQYRQGDYFGSTVNRAARLMSIGHGGQILLSQATYELVKEELPQGILVEDMKSHTLKGLTHPEQVYQILIPGLLSEFPPLNSLENRPNNLPVQVTPFVGRQSEIEALSKLLLDPDVSLVSIIAPGGMGKTRLALELGERMLDQFHNGVFFVELAPISDSENILPAVAEAAGYQFQQNGRSPKRQVLDYLENKQMLLIMDNFEHLTDRAEIVTEMLNSASGLKILVTSRQRLYLPGETLFILPGLQLPDVEISEDASQFAAIELFRQTARRARTDFILTRENLPQVVQICRLVQGMPLGILLAASWITVLSETEIVTEIQRSLDILEAEGGEFPDRQRSIRAVFDYAWSMMNEAEQAVFVKLAVFLGGFTREAAQNVAGADLRKLYSLLSKALISRDADQGRYSVHELLRQYAEEKLQESGGYRQTCRDHSHYYLTYLAAQTADLKGAGQLPTLKRIQTEFKNIRTAWEAAVDNHQYDLIGQSMEGMYLFCFLQSRLEDGKALFDQARVGLAPERDQEPHPVWMALGIRFYRAEDSQSILKERLENSLAAVRNRDDMLEAAFCLHTLGTIAHYVDQNPLQAIEYYEECVAIYRQLGEKYYLAQTLSKLGEAYQLLGQTDLTLKYVNEAYQLQREIGDRMGESETLRALGMTSFQTGDYDVSLDFSEKAFAIQLETNYIVGQATHNLFKGFMIFMAGEIAQGREWVEKGLAQALDVVDYSTQAWCYALLAWFDCTIGDYESAIRNLQKAETIETDPFRQTGAGNPFLRLHINFARSLYAAGNGDNESAKRYLLQPLNLALMTSSQPYMTICSALAAILIAHNGHLDSATELLSLAQKQPRLAIGWEDHWVLLNQVRAELKADLGPKSFEAAWERGKSIELTAAVEEVLQEFEASGE